MSRYINADALNNKLQQHHDFFVNAWGGFREMPIQDKARCDELTNCIAEIFNAPSIDIVFCKECKYDDTIRCPYKVARFGYTDVDFCSCGEARDE